MEDLAFNILETLNANHNVVQMMHSLEQWSFINSEPFMHTVMPNLRCLGLVTERTEQKYRDVGILFDEKPGAGYSGALPIAS